MAKIGAYCMWRDLGIRPSDGELPEGALAEVVRCVPVQSELPRPTAWASTAGQAESCNLCIMML